jgi:hypothetical protein
MPKLLPAIALAALTFVPGTLAWIAPARAQTAGAPSVGGAAMATTAPLALRAENEQRDVDCAGQDVLIEGRHDQYTLHGGCRSLTIRGEGVQVHAEMAPAGRIAIEGNGDQVEWFLHRPGPDPVTAINGEGSRILQEHRLGSIVAPPSAEPVRPDLGPPLELAGSEQSRDADCAGRDVTLTGSGDIVVLRGGCRSLTVNGDGNRVQAEVMPGTRITIVGSKSTVAFAILGTGPDPIVSVNGQGSDAWRIQRLGATSRADAGVGVAPTPRGMVVQGGQGAVVSQMPTVHQPLQDNGPPGVPGDQPLTQGGAAGSAAGK